VSLAKRLVSPGNLMLMDEPTNHLDISSSEMLIEALSGFTGTLLFVSHNQYFVNKLATKIWDIKDAAIVEYPGNLDEYYAHLALIESAAGRDICGTPAKNDDKSHHHGELSGNGPPKKASDRKQGRRERAKKRQEIYETLRPIQNELKEIEDRITQLESRQKAVEKSLADPRIFEDKEVSVPLLTEYKELRDELNELLSKWEDGQNRLESAKTELNIEGEA
ncbi:MAG: ABC transporter ATP-binding protein, partial [Deltaproteobacteria bacterium]